jgi:hypothetical protein
MLPNTTSAELFDATPLGFSHISKPQPVSTSKISSIVNGGTAFLIRLPYFFLFLPTVLAFLKFFRSLLKLPKGKLSVFNIYRPPNSVSKSRNEFSFSHFFEDFQSFISYVTTLSHNFVTTGDFNIHVDHFSYSAVHDSSQSCYSSSAGVISNSSSSSHTGSCNPYC